jgi:hypothetical protein
MRVANAARKIKFSCMATNRANGPKPTTYGDNEEVSGVTYIELFGLTGKRFK